MSSVEAIQIQVPKPREFLTTDYVHPDNAKLKEEAANRYGLLTWWERWRMKRRVAHLRRQLRNYNALMRERDELVKEIMAIKARIEHEADPQLKTHLSSIGREKLARGREVNEALARLAAPYSDYKHYSGWLDYERANRADLKQRQKTEQAIRRGMDREANDLKKVMIHTFKRTGGCHYVKVDRKGNEKRIAPRFFRVDTGPDAHYYWLLTRKKLPLFGYRDMLPYRVNIKDLIDQDVILANMRGALNRDVSVMWSAQGQLIYRVSRLDSPDALPTRVMWRDSWKFFPEHRRDYLPYTVGVEEKRKFKWFDFGSDPHMLVGGRSQSGKSNLVNGIIATMVQTHSPDELRIILIDQKGGLEFTHWADVPHLLGNVGKVLDDVKPMLTDVVKLMRKRMEVLEAARKKKIDDYNRVAEHKMARVLVIIDEMANLIGLGELTEEIHNLIMMITAQGRAVGVHIICATQYPEVKIVPGRLKANMSMRISGAMPSTTASMVILDIVDAANLPNVPGRIVLVSGMNTFTLQSPLIEDADIEHVVSEAKRKYELVDETLWEMADVARAPVWDEARVIQAALDWNNGGLSGSTLHKLLGEESPGERYLRTLCKRVIDRGADGALIAHNGAQYAIRPHRKGKGSALELVSSDGSDGSDMGDNGPASVPTASQPSTPSQPLTESAAD